MPTQYLYLSDGPSKSYQVGQRTVEFKKTSFTQMGLKYQPSEILVQAIQALGEQPLTAEQQHKIRDYLAATSGIKDVVESGELSELLVKRILKDTQYVTGWIVRNIRQVLLNKESAL